MDGQRSSPAQRESLRLVVNGAAHVRPRRPGRSLLEVLREELGLTGAKPGCGEGECGSCTVLLGGRAVRSCAVDAVEAEGRDVVTIEGLSPPGQVHPLQRAFAEAGAAQCGYCTPGMIMSAAALLERHPQPTDAELVEAMDGNLCRCGGYPTIMQAIRRAGRLVPGPGPVSVVPGVQASAPAISVPWDMHPPAERDCFGVLGDGLMVVVPADPEQDSWQPDSVGGGAWLHIDAHGCARLFTGKVNVGQGTCAALASLVAEELDLPAERVGVVMGDTDLCPFDVGTFGSRAMPVAGWATRIAAAKAGEVLRRLAAERLHVDAGAVTLAAGRATVQGGTASFAELLDGRRLIETASACDVSPTAPECWRVAGRRTADPDVWDAVTGARRFTTDLTRPGVLYGRLVRPAALGASLVSLDVSAVDSLSDIHVLHDDGFVGLAAPDARTAARMAGKVRASWDLADQPGESELAAHLRSHPVELEGWGAAVDHSTGDVARALAEASSALSDSYTTAYLAHAPLETRAALAEWNGDRLTVWVGTQTPFILRRALSEALGVDERRVRVIVPHTGGGFGGKHSPETALAAARLALASGRPVKVCFSREEEFRWGYFRPAAIIDVASGVDREGRLSAWEFLNVNSGAAALRCPYDVPNQRVRFQPAASPLPQGPYRSLAAVANTFARERHIERVARALNRDPVGFRLAHLSDERLRAVLETLVARCGWPADAGGGRALGIAVGVEKGGYVATCADVTCRAGVEPAITRIVTVFECGAIVHPAKLRGQVEGATVMGLGGALFEAVRFDRGSILNASFSRYRVPRFSDVPPIEVVLIDRPDIEPAGGGETPIIAVAPAIANGIAAAGGGDLTALPLLGTR